MDRWQTEIEQLEQLDSQETDPEHAILFIGSSSVRLWDTIAEDMAPWTTIRRGYGGAKISDLAVFVERLVNPHEFDALAIFVANDITGAKDDKTPEEVLEIYRYLVATVRKTKPTQPIYFISITPTSARFQVWETSKRANQLIEKYSQSDPSLHYIDTADRYLNSDGTPNDRLFRDDKLHLNRDGYKLWGEIIQAELSQSLPRSP